MGSPPRDSFEVVVKKTRYEGALEGFEHTVSQAPNQPSGQVTPNPRSGVAYKMCSQSECFRVMPNVIMSTMNFSFAQPAQKAGTKRQPQAWDTLVNSGRMQTSSQNSVT